MTDRPTQQGFKTIRLQNINYAESNAYFVTLVAHNRVCLFAEVQNGESAVTRIGEIFHDEWLQGAAMRSEIELGEFVVMPNHLHGIVFLREEQNQSARRAL